MASSGLRIAAQYVVDTDPVPAQIMNISFGACEADRTQADVQFWDSLFSQGAAEGISTFVASGDAGAAGCDTYFQTPPQNQIASPNYICSSSYSTCVGEPSLPIPRIRLFIGSRVPMMDRLTHRH